MDVFEQQYTFCMKVGSTGLSKEYIRNYMGLCFIYDVIVLCFPGLGMHMMVPFTNKIWINSDLKWLDDLNHLKTLFIFPVKCTMLVNEANQPALLGAIKTKKSR